MREKKSVPMAMDNGKRRLLWFMLAYLVLSIFLFDPKLFIGGDNIRYIVLAESISSGKGYRDLTKPDEPQYTLYPPGFSLLLVPVIALFGPNVLLLKIIPLLCGLGAFLFFCLLAQEIFDRRSIYPILAALSLPILINNNHWILSEMPFICFSLGGLYFFQKYLGKKTTVNLVLFTVFSVYAVLIRSAGITLVAALALYLLVKRDFRALLILLAVFIPIMVLWTLRNSSIPGMNTYDYWFLKKNPYVDESPRIGLGDFFKRLGFNLNFYTFTIFPSVIFSAFQAPFLLTICGVILTAAVITGIVIRIKNFNYLDWYLIFSLVIVLTWSETWSSERFLLPILSVLVFYVFFGFYWLDRRLKSRYFIPVITGAIIIVNLYTIFFQGKQAVNDNLQYLRGDRYAGYSVDWRRYFEAIDWIKRNVPENQVIMARKPEFVYFLSGHKSFVFPYTTDFVKMRQSIDQADYILLDQFFWTGTTRRVLIPALQKEPNRYVPVYQTPPPEFFVLKIKK
jgi:hypothetical protein